MNTKNKVITILITLIIGVVLLLSNMSKRLYEDVHTYYQVYLNGNQIGIIDNKDKLYELIDNSQSSIKEKYQVTNVYPPTDLKIVETNTYLSHVDNVEDVYEKIQEEDDFAVKGYVITIKGEDREYKVYVLDKNVFYNAAKRFVKAFLDEDEYDKYINNTQAEIVDTGRIIENMQFIEDISIKEDYISVNENIYTDELLLTHYLLFGSEPESKSYTIKLGDTIESISEANQLNVEEFLIANTKYKDESAVLRVGDKVDVTLIDPQLTFVYNLYEIKDEIVYYEKTTKLDNTKNVGYSEVTTPGINGIERRKETYSVTNGERSQEAEVKTIAVLQEVQNQVTTKGTKYVSSGISGIYNPVNTSGDFGWPTNQGYVITSYRGWRWGRMHQGIDISGAGNFGSPIYAVADGVVTYAFNGCPSRGSGYGDPCGGGMGNSINIDHGNGYVTRYGHLHQTVLVKVGQTVKKGQKIGYMGNSGSSTGVHLHYEVKYNGVNIDPLRLYR